MKYKLALNSKWLQIGSNWWITNSALAWCEPPRSESELLQVLKQNINTSSVLILDDCILLYSGQFYSDNIFYTKTNGQILLSDNIRQLIAQDYKLDTGSIANYIFTKGFYFNQTPFAGTYKVSQGCLCKLTDDSAHERYLHLIRPNKVACTPKRFSSLMEEKLHVVNGKQVIATLSGGVDSSYVAAFIKRHFNCYLKGFHIYCSEGESTHRELKFARLLAKTLQIPLIEIDFSWQRFNDTFPHFCRLSPLPFPNSGYRYYLLHRYGNENITADYFVSGDASDTLFELSPDFYLFNKINLFDRWIPLNSYEKLDRYIDRSRPDLRIAESFRWRMNKYLDFRLRLFHWKGTKIDYFDSWREPFFTSQDSRTLLELIETRGMYDLDNRLFLLNTYFSYLELPIFVPIIRQLFGAEYYTPFLDSDIISLALNLSNNQTKLKKFLKQIASSYLPSAIVNRKKMGLIIPLQSWVLGPMRAIAIELLLGDRGLICRSLVNEDALTALVTDFFDGGGQFGWCEIMSLLALEVWLRVNIDEFYEPTDLERVSLNQLVYSQQSSWF